MGYHFFVSLISQRKKPSDISPFIQYIYANYCENYLELKNMKSLKSYLEAEIKTKNIPLVIVDDITLDEVLMTEMEDLSEGKDHFSKVLGTTYTYRIDKPRGIPGPGNLKHIHLYAKDKKQVFAMNLDGSAHDGYHQVEITKEIASFLRNKGFTVPANNLIEWIDFKPSSEKQLLFD